MEERERLGLRGLVPPYLEQVPMDAQIRRELHRLNALKDPLDKYRHMNNLSDRNKTLFYRLLCDNLKELAPVVYTPTVGQACQQVTRYFGFVVNLCPDLPHALTCARNINA
jgi:malate dehydrogenase (oxaloacetate-decarboxylating)(NADP+)